MDKLFLFSKAQNICWDISGLLLYNEGTFLQVLEGENDEVEKLLTKIKRDKRHNQITVLMDKPIKQRLFKNFKTGLVSSKNEKELMKLKSKIQLPKTSKYAKSLRAILYSFTLPQQSLIGYDI